MSVAALEGKTRFTAGGKSVALAAGTTSSSVRGAPPDDPERIAEEVLLNVVWPSAEHHGAEAEIAGRAAPSTVVLVNGAAANMGADGRFTAKVHLREGKNLVHVEAEDVAGRSRRDAIHARSALVGAAHAGAGDRGPLEEVVGILRLSPKSSRRLRELLAAAGRLAEFGRFAAQQIHELRQPLFAIKGLGRSCCSRRSASSWTRCWTSPGTSSTSRSA